MIRIFVANLGNVFMAHGHLAPADFPAARSAVRFARHHPRFVESRQIDRDSPISECDGGPTAATTRSRLEPPASR